MKIFLNKKLIKEVRGGRVLFKYRNRQNQLVSYVSELGIVHQ